jgi:hypothetical protein
MKSEHSGNGREQATETPDVSHLRNVDVAHEMSDVHIRGIVTFIVGLTVMTVAVYLLMWGMFRLLNTQETKKDLPESPMAMRGKDRLPPEPRLQSAPGFGEDLEKEAGVKPALELELSPRDPLWEINVLREHWEHTLTNGAKDQSGKLVVLPIDEAKKELLKQGLPARTSQPPEGGPDDMPTAASSGRVTEKRRQ